MLSHIEDNYEIILINDCSHNTIEVLKSIALSNDHVTAIDVTKNFGQHAALMAGIRQSKGDIVVCLDDDGQTPPTEVYKIIGKLDNFDVCYASYEEKSIHCLGT